MNNYFMPHAKKKFFIEPSKVIYIYIERERKKKRNTYFYSKNGENKGGIIVLGWELDTFFFWKEFQLMTFTSNTSSLSSD